MHLQSSYPNHSSPSITLDTICNSALFHSAKWNPQLKRNQSHYLLIHLISKFYGTASHSLFHAKIKSSHAALAAHLDLSRQWTCKLIAVLRSTGWITTHSPRLPNGKQEITTFSPGRTFKRLLVMLCKSKQRPYNRVNDPRQKIPTKEQTEKNKIFLRTLREQLSQKLGIRT